MTHRRVYTLWKHPLFQETVRRLLNHPDVEWLGSHSEYKLGKRKIDALRPDVIIIEQESEGVENAQDVMGTASWDVSVVSLSLSDNVLNLYSHRVQTVGHADDLLRIVLDKT